MFLKEPQRSNCAGHKMYTGLWQETIKSYVIFWDVSTKLLNLIYFEYCTNITSQILFIWKLKQISAYKYTLFYPAGNHPGHAKCKQVTQSIYEAYSKGTLKVKSSVNTGLICQYYLFNTRLMNFWPVRRLYVL